MDTDRVIQVQGKQDIMYHHLHVQKHILNALIIVRYGLGMHFEVLHRHLYELFFITQEKIVSMH